MAELHPDTRAALWRGGALYAAGRYFEAHEAWEEAWRVEGGAVKLLLQGLIQVAAGMVKGERDARPEGSVRLFEAALTRLEPLPEELAGVDLAALRQGVRRAAEAARQWRDGVAPGPGIPAPRLALRM
jgi:predicted metal-dependent hydrolase